MLTLRGCEPSLNVIQQMTGEMVHRGPDDSGTYADRYAVLGHRRLSIIDVNNGRQPMVNEDGTLRIVYNGEVFNHAELRPELEQSGHRYQSHCDTETILHSYEEYGEACVQRFRGMFSFADLGHTTAAFVSAHATGWGSNRSITSGTDIYLPLLQKSRRYFDIRRLPLSLRLVRFQNTSLSDT